MSEEPGPWTDWLADAVDILDRAGLSRDDWRWGGGTVLAMRHRHRISHDIDIFLEDIQYLGLLSPRLNDLDVPYRETANVVRLEYGSHEVDFIVSMQVLPCAAEDERLAVPNIAGRVRTMADDEIIARKFHHRAAGLAARDIYDFAVVARARPERFETPDFLNILRLHEATLHHALNRRSLPQEYAAIDTGGYSMAPSFESAAAALRVILERARG